MKTATKSPTLSGPETDNPGEIYAAPVTTETAAETQPQHKHEDQQECKICLVYLQEENQKLKQELSKKKLDKDFLKDKNSKEKFYTGLPSFALLMGVLQQISPSLPDTDRKNFRCS